MLIVKQIKDESTGEHVLGESTSETFMEEGAAHTVVSKEEERGIF